MLRAGDLFTAFSTASQPPDADYAIIHVGANAHVARARSGAAALLVPLDDVGSEMIRQTSALSFRTLQAVEFARDDQRSLCPAAVIECTNPQLLRTFCAMVAALFARIEGAPPPTRRAVESYFAEWERLFQQRQRLSAESELGLWGELWLLAQSTRLKELLAAWRGPEKAAADFVLGGVGLEVKASRRAHVHSVSQTQVDGSLGELEIFLVSMHVMIDPIKGTSLAELVERIASLVGDVASFEERLAMVGYAREDEAEYGRKWLQLREPAFFRAADVPRVRAADPGVTAIRFQVELSEERALAAHDLDRIRSLVGLTPSDGESACV